MGLSGDELGIVLLSLKVALTSVVFSLPPAILVAYVLARGRFPGKMLLDAVVHLPLVLPPVVVGFALLALFGKRGAIGSWLDAWFGIVFAFRWTGAALAAAIMGFPLMVRAIRLSFAAIDRRFETVARTLGGSPVSVFLSVTLPLALPDRKSTRLNSSHVKSSYAVCCLKKKKMPIRFFVLNLKKKSIKSGRMPDCAR